MAIMLSLLFACCLQANAGDDAQAARRKLLSSQRQPSLAERLLQCQGLQQPKHVNRDVHAIPQEQPVRTCVPQKRKATSKPVSQRTRLTTGQAAGTKVGRDGLTDAERQRQSIMRQWLRYQQELK